MVIEEILERSLDSEREFHIDIWKIVCIPKLTKKAMSYPIFERVITVLVCHATKAISKQERHAVDILRYRFLGNYKPQEISEHELLQDKDFYRFLAAEGILKPLNKDATEFEISSPLMRSMLIRQVLPSIYKNVPDSEFPRRPGGSLDVLEGLKSLVRIFDQKLLRDADRQAFKISKVLVERFYAAVPSEHVYDQELTRLLMNWIGNRFSNIIRSLNEIRSISGYCAHSAKRIIVAKIGNYSIELVATATEDELREHFDRTISYSRNFPITVGHP
jgi:hypothetical protein